VLPLFRAAVAERRVVKLMIGWHHRWHIPYRLGIIRQGPNNTCVPVRSGFMAHRDAGRCGGGHPDVGVPSVVGRLVAEAKAQDQPRKPLTKPQKHACDVLNFHRRRHVALMRMRGRNRSRPGAARRSTASTRLYERHHGAVRGRSSGAALAVAGAVA
jgi:hypothetical protein